MEADAATTVQLLRERERFPDADGDGPRDGTEREDDSAEQCQHRPLQDSRSQQELLGGLSGVTKRQMIIERDYPLDPFPSAIN